MHPAALNNPLKCYIFTRNLLT